MGRFVAMINAFVLPFLQLSAADIQRAEEVVKQTLQENAFAGTYPEMMYRTKDEWPFNVPMRDQRLAMAARNADGNAFILVNTDGPPRDLDSLMQHELAHIMAWDQHGEKIREHGTEFRNICRKVVANNSSKFCKDR